MKKKSPPMPRTPFLLLLLLLLLPIVISACSSSRPEPERLGSGVGSSSADPAETRLDGALAIEPPAATSVHQSRLIAWRDMTAPTQIQLRKGERWRSPPSQLVQDLLLSCLEDGGAASAVIPASDAVNANYVVRGNIDLFEVQFERERGQLVIDIDLFLEQRTPRRVILSRRLTHSSPVTTLDEEQATEAFAQSTEHLCREALKLIAAGRTAAR
jgi:ABC-type uncharacterized transport system auxiliary subunit